MNLTIQKKADNCKAFREVFKPKSRIQKRRLGGIRVAGTRGAEGALLTNGTSLTGLGLLTNSGLLVLGARGLRGAREIALAMGARGALLVSLTLLERETVLT